MEYESGVDEVAFSSTIFRYFAIKSMGHLATILFIYLFFARCHNGTEHIYKGEQ